MEFDLESNVTVLSKKEYLLNMSAIATNEEDKSLDGYFRVNKRIYQKILGTALTDATEIFKHCESARDTFINFKRKSMSEEGIQNIDEFLDIIRPLIKETIDIVFDYVKEEYKVEIADTSHRNEELQFVEEHYFIIATASIIASSSILLVSEYVHSHVDKQYQDLAYSDTFIEILNLIVEEKYADQNIDIINKIYKLVESRVKSTEYSDSVIWNYLYNYGIDPVEYTQILFRKLLVDILVKISLDQNIINYFHVVLKQQLKYLFRSKLPIPVKPINNATDPDEGTVFDKSFTRYNSNELNQISARIVLNDIITKMEEETGYTVTDEDITYLHQNMTPSKAQTTLYFSYLLKYVDDYEMLYSATNTQYYKLIILIAISMNQENLISFSYIMMSNENLTSVTQTPKTKKLTKKQDRLLNDAAKLAEIREERYSHLDKRIDKIDPENTFLEKLLGAGTSRSLVVPQTVPVTFPANYVYKDVFVISDLLNMIESFR